MIIKPIEPFFFDTETGDKVIQISRGGQNTIRKFRKLEKNMEDLEDVSIDIVERQQELERIFDRYSEAIMVKDAARTEAHAAYFKILLPFTKGKVKGLSSEYQAILKQEIQEFVHLQGIDPLNNSPAFKALLKEVMGMDYEVWRCEMMGSITVLMQSYLQSNGILLYAEQDQFPANDGQLFNDIIDSLNIHFDRLLDDDLSMKAVKKEQKFDLKYYKVSTSNKELDQNRQIFVYDSMVYHLTQMEKIAHRSDHTSLREHFSREIYTLKLLKSDYKNIQKICLYFKELLQRDFESSPTFSKNLFEKLESAYLSQQLKETLPEIVSEWLNFTINQPGIVDEIVKLDYINKIIKWNIKILKNQWSRLPADELYEYIVLNTSDFEISDDEMLEEELEENNRFIIKYNGFYNAIKKDSREGIKHIMEIYESRKQLDVDFIKMEEKYWKGGIDLGD